MTDQSTQPLTEQERTYCTGCLKHIMVRKDGTFWHHRERKVGWYRPPVCKNSGKPADRLPADLGLDQDGEGQANGNA